MLPNETVDEFRERMTEKAVAQQRFKILFAEAAESQRRRPKTKAAPKAEKVTELVSKKPPRAPKPKIIPCIDCGRPTRPGGTTLEAYPNTVARRSHCLCRVCTTIRTKQKHPPRICAGCDKHLPITADQHLKWCSNSCRCRTGRAQKRQTSKAGEEE